MNLKRRSGEKRKCYFEQLTKYRHIEEGTKNNI